MHIHTYRSFHEIMCVLGIATRSEDFLIDCLSLKKELNVLNKILTNPRVIKVAFLAERFLESLQKAYGVFMLNLLDLNVAEKRVEEIFPKQLRK